MSTPYSPHCQYCGCNVMEALGYCPESKHYYCNGKGMTAQSHLVHHFLNTRSTTIQIPDWNPWHEMQMHCEICNSDEIISLGIALDCENMIHVLCRNCLFTPIIASRGINTQSFMGMISNNEFNPQLIKIPTLSAEQHVSVTRAKECVQQTLAIIGGYQPGQRNRKAYSKIPSHQLTYADDTLLQKHYHAFIGAEITAGEEQSKTVHTITAANWGDDRHFTTRATPPLFKALNLGAKVHISAKVDCSDSEEASVLTQQRNMYVKFRFRRQSALHDLPKMYLMIDFDKSVFNRERMAVSNFSDLDQHFKNLFLGHMDTYAEDNSAEPIQFHLSPQVRFPPNESQETAITSALSHRITFIQGPPGTGKTTTISLMIDSFIKSGNTPILICAQSNFACDNAAMAVHNTGADVVRLISQNREELGLYCPGVESTMVRAKRLGISEHQVIQSADVVVMTCAMSGSKRAKGIHCRVVIIDEAAQCTDTNILVPLLHQPERLIMVGDHRQLGPLVKSKAAKKAKYDQPLFERAVVNGVHIEVLLEQYRMHPAISYFPSAEFYGGRIQDGVTAAQRQQDMLPLPLIFWHMKGEEEIEAGQTFLNKTEAESCCQLITHLLQRGAGLDQIGVITPYSGQQGYLSRMVTREIQGATEEMLDDLEIASVDSFQGREKDYIIMSCVRSNENGDIGFLSDLRRLCVSITRAKYGMIIIGNYHTLKSSPTFKKLIIHCNQMGSLVEGPMHDWKQIALEDSDKELPPPPEQHMLFDIDDEDNSEVEQYF